MPLSLTQRAGPSVSRPSPRSRNRRISLGFSAALKTRHFSNPICLPTLQATASDQIHRALPGYTRASPFFTFLCAPKIASTFSTIHSSLRWSSHSLFLEHLQFCSCRSTTFLSTMQTQKYRILRVSSAYPS
jgi:hypothetical protein